MKSIDVVTAVLEYMIIHIKTKSGLQGLPLTLKFVLTIPTCGCTELRTFMREAAIKVIMVFHFVYFEAYPIYKKRVISMFGMFYSFMYAIKFYNNHKGHSFIFLFCWCD